MRTLPAILCLLAAGLLLPSCQSDLQTQGRSDAAATSTMNEVNRGLFAAPDGAAPAKAAEPDGRELIHRVVTQGPYILEQIQLPNEPALIATLVYRGDSARPRPLIISFASGDSRAVETEILSKLPARPAAPVAIEKPVVSDLFKELVDRGVMIAMISPRPIPWPAGRNRWVWPTPDEAGAEFFITWAKVAPWDFGLLIDFLQTRADVDGRRIGYFGFSTTALIGYALVASEPRITVAVLSGGAGDLTEFAAGWARNYDWPAKGKKLWSETLEKLASHDPKLKAGKIFPAAILMMNGGRDKIIPIEAARSFFTAALPHYAGNEDRLQLVTFEGETHNWNHDWWKKMLLDWFQTYLIDGRKPKPVGKN